MLEHYTRRYYQRLLVDPSARLLLKFNYNKPSQITLFSAIVGILAAFSLYFNWIVLACVLLLLSGYLDTLDGTLARLSNTTTEFGSVLDIMADRVVEFSMVLALYSVAPSTRATTSLFMLGSFLLCITSFLVVGIFTQKASHKSFFYSPGLIERPEAFLFFILMMLIPGWFNFLAGALTLLVLYTTIIRTWQFYKQHRDSSGEQHANT